MTKRFLSIVSLVALALPSFAYAATGTVLAIEFPVDGEVRFSDDFGDPRSGGRTHEGIDILGKKMMPLVAAADGRITYLTESEPSWGWSLTLTDAAGWRFKYLHINDDTPGTDDGKGGYANAFAPGIREGVRVTKGQLIAFTSER